MKVIIVYIFWVFCITIFQRKAQKEKQDQKSREQKRHFHLIDNNNCLKQRALDNSTFAWGKAKGFFVIKVKRQIKCITWTSKQ